MVPELQDSSECAESALGNMADSSATSNVVIVGEQGIAIDPVVTALVHTLSVVFSCLTQSRVNSIKGAVRPGVDAFTNRVNDIVRYEYRHPSLPIQSPPLIAASCRSSMHFFLKFHVL